MKNYEKLAAALVASWFLFALAASALHLFQNDWNRIGAAVAVAALAPILGFAVWFTASSNFRQFVLSLNPSTLSPALLENPGVRVRAAGGAAYSPGDLRFACRIR